MATTIFILGAGASKHAGAPLMIEFLDVATKLYRTGQTEARKQSFELVFRAIGELQSVHSKAQLDIQNVESVFAAFEMAKTLGRFGDHSQEEIDRLVDAMNDLITGTLEGTLRFPAERRAVQPSQVYGDFVNLIGELLQEAKPKESVAIVTFNYDIAIDFACYKLGAPVTYALGDSEGQAAIPLLKLHGSLNWGRCAKCQSVVPWTLREFFRQRQRDIYSNAPTTVRLDIVPHLHSLQHCGEPVAAQPVIVPPTWNKSAHFRTLSQVWSRAARELGEAHSIFVIGYSLPPSDAFFRHLYALGTVGQTPLQRFWVFNPDTSGDVERRFMGLLGPGARQRFGYFPLTFDAAVSKVREEFF